MVQDKPTRTNSLVTRGAHFIGFLVALLVIFLVPFAVPPASGTSYSYMFGYNNKLAVLLLCTVALAFALWTRGFGMHLQPAAAPALDAAGQRRYTQWSRTLVGGAVLTAGILSVALWLRVPWLSPDGFAVTGEAGYFLDRYAMFSMGYKPYSTLQFYYGPLMFYPPVWFHDLTHWTMRDSYFFILLVDWVAGTLMLWDTVRHLPASATRRWLLFVLVFVQMLIMIFIGGMNYTPFRFLLAPWFAVAVYRVQRRSVPRALMVALVGVSVALLYSPEQGLALFLATLLFFGVCVRGRATVLPLLVFFAAGVGVCVLAARAGYLAGILQFGGGEHDLPLLLNTVNLMWIGLLVLAGCALVCAFFDGDTRRPELYLVCLALGLTPSGLGRADTGHIFLNSFMAAAVALLVVWRKPVIGLPAMVLSAAFTLHFLWTPILPTFRMTFGPHTLAHLHLLLHRPAFGDDAALAAERAQLEPLLKDQPDGRLFAPLGYRQPVWPAPPLPIVTGRDFGFESLHFPHGKLAEIEQRRDRVLLIQDWYTSLCATASPSYLEEMARGLLDPWVVPRVKHADNPGIPMCQYLLQHYRPLPQASPIAGYVLLERTDPFE